MSKREQPVTAKKTRILLYITYRGTNYQGWQKQPGGIATLQETIEKAIIKIALHPVTLIAAGRTDKKVHAVRQTAHFDTTATRPLSAWVAGVNGYLPPDIAILGAQVVPPSFHARFNAVSRSYRYMLYVATIRPVLWRDSVGWTFLSMDVAKMNEAAKLLLGRHDFSSFQGPDCEAKTPIKNLSYARVYLWHNLIYFDFKADGFLHHMVRNIVGALIKVGCGKWSVDDFLRFVEAKSRLHAPPTFMAGGLYFFGADYPAHFHLERPAAEPGFWSTGEGDFVSTD